jgi:transposase InsO family protein
MRFAFIQAHAEQFHVVTMCRVLAVSKAGYYAWIQRAPSVRAKTDAALTDTIRELFRRKRKRYGSPRIHAELAAQEQRHGAKRVARLMRAARLRAKGRRFRVPTTDSRHTLPVAPNVLARQFAVADAEGPRAVDRVWVGDITYLPTREGWLFLAVVLDLASRRVIGWAMHHTIDARLTQAALRMALATRCPAPGVLHHTDRGSQYAAHAYQALLAAHGMTCSMSRPGDCWDNAVAESFFATLKRELVADADWATRDEARTAVFEYIEVWYNRERRHSSLGYLSPVAYERQLEATQAA